MNDVKGGSLGKDEESRVCLNAAGSCEGNVGDSSERRDGW